VPSPPGRFSVTPPPPRWCLGFLETLEQFVGRHGSFDPATRDAHFGDFVAVLDEARSFYCRVAETADR
jgi:hypothetical protein